MLHFLGNGKIDYKKKKNSNPRHVACVKEACDALRHKAQVLPSCYFYQTLLRVLPK